MTLPASLVQCLRVAYTEKDEQKCYKEYLDVDDLETHVYIIYGAFGGLILLLIVALFFAFGMILSLKKKVENGNFNNNMQQSYGGGGAAAAPMPMPKSNNDPLQQRGYEAYSGGGQRQQSMMAAPPVHGNGYGAPAPTRNTYQSQGQPAPGPGAPSRRPQSGYDNSGYDRNTNAGGGVRVLPGGAAPSNSNSNWNKRLGKGLDKFEDVNNGFGHLQDVGDFADNAGLSEAAFGGNFGDIPGMDQAGGAMEFAGGAADGLKMGNDAMGAFKNKGFGGKSKKLW